MKQRITCAMVIASLVGLVAALVGAIYVIATDPVLALTWWVLATGYCVLVRSRGGDAVVVGASLGTIATIVALAGRALYTLGVPANICIAIVAAFAIFVVGSIVLVFSRPEDPWDDD
jgi:hypothetical protein